MAKRGFAALTAVFLILASLSVLFATGGFVAMPESPFEASDAMWEEALKQNVVKTDESTTISAESRYIVKFKSNVPLTEIEKLLKGKEYTLLSESKDRLFAISLPQSDFLYRYQDIIEYSEEDAVRITLAIVNDPTPTPYYENMSIPSAWDSATGSKSVIVAVLDTGISRNHEDLKDVNILPGYDAVARSAGVYGDEVGHGTGVAGIIAATANNDLGIAGVAHGVTILPVKVSSTGTTIYSSDLVRGIRFAADSGAKIINMSIGGYSASLAEQEAVNYAASKGCILIAAAGNGGNGEFADSKSYPASYEGVISVASCDSLGERSYFSQYNDMVDVAVIGENIAMPRMEGESSLYITDSGTSYSCAIVSGIAALTLSSLESDVRFNSAEFEALITQVCGTRRDDNLGYGILDAKKAIDAAAGPIITGVANGKKYSHSVKIGFNRGTATINGEKISDGESYVADGKHTLVVTYGDLVKTLVFSLDYTPLSYEFSEFATHAEFSFQRGSATLDGFPYASGEEIYVSGRHEFVLTEGEETVSKIIDLKYALPAVYGIEHGKTYNHPVEISVVGNGTAYLDDKEIFGEVVVAQSGTHTLKTKSGNGSKRGEYTFTIDYSGKFGNSDYANAKAAIDEENGYICLYGDSLVGVRIYDIDYLEEYALFIPTGTVYSHAFLNNSLLLFGDYGVTVLDRAAIFEGEDAIVNEFDPIGVSHYNYVAPLDTLYGFGNGKIYSVDIESGEAELITETDFNCEAVFYEEGYFYILSPSADSRVRVFDALSESIVAEYDIGFDFDKESLCFGGGYLSVGNRLYNGSTGEFVLEFAANRAVKIDKQYVYSENRITEIATGKEIGSFPFALSNIYSTGNNVYIFGRANQYGIIPTTESGIYLYGAANRVTKGFSNSETANIYRNNIYYSQYSTPASVAASQEMLYLTVSDRNCVYSLNTKAMEESEAVYLRYKPSKVICGNGYLAVMFSNASTVYVALESNLSGGKYVPLTNICTDGVIADSTIYAITRDNSVMRINISNSTHNYTAAVGQDIETDGSLLYIRNGNLLSVYSKDMVKQPIEFAATANKGVFVGNGVAAYRTVYGTDGSVIAKLDYKIIAFKGNTIVTDRGIYDLLSNSYIGDTGVYSPKFVMICGNNSVVGIGGGTISVNSCAEGDEVVTDPNITGIEAYGAYPDKALINYGHGIGYLDGTPFESGNTVSSYGSHIFSLSLPCGRNIQIPFSITPPLNEIQFILNESTISVGETITLRVLYLPEGASSIPVVFSADGNGIEITQDGIVTAKAVGKYTVTATAETKNGTLTATTEITVRDDLITPKPESGIYIDRNNGFIKGIKPGTSIKELEKLFFNAESITVWNSVSPKRDYISTGDKIQLNSSAGITDELFAVISGDTDGDGFISAYDICRLENILKGYDQEIPYVAAADINGNGVVADNDLKLLKNMLLSGYATDYTLPPATIVGECTMQALSTAVHGDIIETAICISGAKQANGVCGNIYFGQGLEFIEFSSDWIADCLTDGERISFYAYNNGSTTENHYKFVLNLKFRITALPGKEISVWGEDIIVSFPEKCETFGFLRTTGMASERVYDEFGIYFNNADKFVFDKSVNEYIVTIPYNHAFADIYAVCKKNETVQISSCYIPQSGEETVTVAYTDINGRTDFYNITVSRKSPPAIDNNCLLADLEIEGHKLTPRFDSDYFDYSVSVPFGTEKINVYCVAQNETAKAVVSDTTLTDKTNIITVTVAALDGESLTYTITVTVLPKAEPENSTQDKPVATTDQGKESNSPAASVTVVLIIGAIAAVVVVYIKKKHPNE